ncbi:MAG: hypothetical protein AB1486_22720 [Planctomycetota bacterium]
MTVTVLIGSLVALGLSVATPGDGGAPAPTAGPAPDTVAGGVAQEGQDLSEAERDQVVTAFGKLPLYFIENRGLLDERVAYYVKGRDKTLYFTSEGVTFALVGEDEQPGRWVVKLNFAGARAGVRPRGEEKQEAVFSYFKGKPDEWKTGLPTFAKLVYDDLWPGIDIIYSGTVDRLKYEFVVAPGADPGQIRLEYQGATQVAITEVGTLAITTPVAHFEDARPSAYQMNAGVRSEVGVSFAPRATVRQHAFGFELGDFDPAVPLVIDPEMLIYCGYIGGASGDDGLDIAVDATGSAYLTGGTSSDQSSFPVTVGPDLSYNGDRDAFVAKANSQGAGLVYCGYIGGANYDYGLGICVDTAGAAYVTGHTESSESSFPVTVGPDLSYNGNDDAFVAKVNPQGTGLVYCGYIGGANYDYGAGICVDAAGAAYVTGHTESSESSFPVVVGPDLSYNGAYDAFVAKVTSDGIALAYCGYIGGSMSDHGVGITVDVARAAYVTGQTYSDQSSFPVSVGPDLSHNGYRDAFVAKVTNEGTRLLYCGYVGGAGEESATDIAVDGQGATYVTGITNSDESSFPVSLGPDLTYNGGEWDAFVVKVTTDGTGLAYCGYIGGVNVDAGYGPAVDAAGAMYVTGATLSDQSTFPVTVGPDLTHNGGLDAFVAKIPNLEFPASWANYGTGWPGTNGVPSFTASNDPILCSSITLQIGNSLGAPTSAFLFLGLAPANIGTPFGGTLLLVPKWIYSLFLLGSGTSIPGEVPCDPGFAGLHLYFQVLEMDPGASQGISFTPGLELVFGYW